MYQKFIYILDLFARFKGKHEKFDFLEKKYGTISIAVMSKELLKDGGRNQDFRFFDFQRQNSKQKKNL